jgi:murein DD-endopeptidase MepM/ murein hydrolase activator NlpD
LYQFGNLAAESGGGGSTAALRFDQALHRPAIARGFGTRAAPVRRHRDFELVTDLGTRIGSGEWFRGIATCFGLCAAAWWLAPGFEPIPGAVAAPMSDAHWDEARTLSIAPLAYGADTGKRMASTDAVQPLLDTPERSTVDLVATLGKGDGFARALERAGVASNEASAVARLVSAVLPPDDLKPGVAMDLTLGRRPNRAVARPLEALAFRARFDLKLAVVRDGGGFTLQKTPISVDETPLRIQGLVGDSLYRSARAAGVPAKAVEGFIRAVAGKTEIGSLSASDRFDIIVEHRRAATGETQSGQLLYAGLDRASGQDLQLLQWTEGGRTQWFEASGVGRQSGVLTRPVSGMVSSNFGMRRHPILGYSRMHRGMDFRAGYGTPILAATDGRVIGAGWAGGYGQQVKIAHAGGLMTSYSHMSRIAARPGSMVRQGQVIGYVGSTGLSTGPHLHYELYKDGVPINPMSLKFVMRSQLAGDDLAAFRSKLRSLLSVPVGATRMAEAPGAKRPKA